VRLQLAGFPLLPATEMLSSVKLPLDRLALAGSASGNVETVWVGSIRDADVRLKLGIVPSQKLAAGETRLRAKSMVSIADRETSWS